MEFKRFEGESEEQFLWRIGQAKDNGLIDCDWATIADIMNHEFREDETEYRTEASYRKPYQQALRFFNAGVFKQNSNPNDIGELQKAKHEIRKEKQKLFDERTALNRSLRERARIDNDVAYLEKVISENGFNAMPPLKEKISIVSDCDMIIPISDLHFGCENDTPFGVYSVDHANERMSRYFQEIKNIQTVNACENAYVMLLGDLINGNIHQTVQLESRENVVEQVKGASELISHFVYQLSKIFENVYITGVDGNHSRVSFKDDVLRGERLDAIIPWYMQAALKHIENVSFTYGCNYDSTICNIFVRNNEYLGVHGDYDAFSEAGVSRLVLMLGNKPAGIFYGHMHHNSYDDIGGVKIIRSGCFSGTGDNYSIQKRLYGKPGQMVAIVNNTGIESLYPIELT